MVERGKMEVGREVVKRKNMLEVSQHAKVELAVHCCKIVSGCGAAKTFFGGGMVVHSPIQDNVGLAREHLGYALDF